jgi:GAF domain-containing protein
MERPGAVIADQDANQDLSASLIGLSRLLTSSQPLERTLTQVAELAVRAIPGAEGAGVTLLEAGRPDTVVASAPFVREVDDIQYALGEGPCISAVDSQCPQRSGSLGGEPRWPRFGPRVGRLGVHSALSVPLVLPGRQIVGALNVYARIKDAFAPAAETFGALFAEPAAISIFNAQVLAQSQRLATQLSEALSSRATIDQAIGILMAQSGASADEAFERLRAISQREKTKLSKVAERLVDDAVRRARGRVARSHAHKD